MATYLHTSIFWQNKGLFWQNKGLFWLFWQNKGLFWLFWQNRGLFWLFWQNKGLFWQDTWFFSCLHTYIYGSFGWTQGSFGWTQGSFGWTQVSFGWTQGSFDRLHRYSRICGHVRSTYMIYYIGLVWWLHRDIYGSFGWVQGSFGWTQGSFGWVHGSFGWTQGSFVRLQKDSRICGHGISWDRARVLLLLYRAHLIAAHLHIRLF